MEDMTESYHWGEDASGVQLGLQAAPSTVRKGQAVNVRVAVRTRSSSSLTLESSFALVLRRGDLIDEQGGGPRATEGVTLDAGEFREILGWQLDEEQLGAEAGERVIWAAYRPSVGAEIRSGEARIEVLA